MAESQTPTGTIQSKLVLIISLTAAWLLWSGIYKPHLLALGVVSIALTFWLVERMGYFDERLFALRFSFQLLKYWVWLGGQVIKSSIDVTKIVLDPKLPVSPTVVDIESISKSDFDVVLLANSITLTPGTLSMDVHDSSIKVHALTAAGADDLLEGDMNRRVNAVSGS